MSADERLAPIGIEITRPEPDLLDLKRQQAEIETIQSHMKQLRARIDRQLDEQRTTVDVIPVRLDELPPAAE